MIADSVKKEILKRIRNAEIEHNVKVLYAIESGSRAWGFESPNSDYDVRFIYTHPKDWYVSVDLEEKRDVIEYDIIDEIDINGWDVRKALRLFWKSNPSFVEWLQSPIVYVDDNHFAPQARNLLDSIYSVEKGIYHYRSMARTNYRGYLKSSLVPIKKYFYVLRPLLSIMWLEKYDQPAPIVFDQLRGLVFENQELDEEISKLLQRKKTSKEKEIAPAIPIINKFIDNELNRLEKYGEKTKGQVSSISSLNDLFHEVLAQTDSNC
ncbi:MAG: nucleotidyltransferase domain-containing protein [gamma proteobacterium symbiont of Taylorina sp.]|nr:nucleotidyltransferase domain-containing protein [gamma proteobacterium symbiont of Taylorina sp.]